MSSVGSAQAPAARTAPVAREPHTHTQCAASAHSARGSEWSGQALLGTYVVPTLALHSEEAPKDGGHIFLALMQLIIWLERNNQRTVNNKVGCRESALSGHGRGTAQGGLGGEQDPQVWVGPGALLRPQEGHGARGTPGSEELKHLHDRASWEQKSSQTSATSSVKWRGGCPPAPLTP